MIIQFVLVIINKNILVSFCFDTYSLKMYCLNFIEIVKMHWEWHCLQLLSILFLYMSQIRGVWKSHDQAKTFTF